METIGNPAVKSCSIIIPLQFFCRPILFIPIQFFFTPRIHQDRSVSIIFAKFASWFEVLHHCFCSGGTAQPLNKVSIQHTDPNTARKLKLINWVIHNSFTFWASDMKRVISCSKALCILTEDFSSQLHTEWTSLEGGGGVRESHIKTYPLINAPQNKKLKLGVDPTW